MAVWSTPPPLLFPYTVRQSGGRAEQIVNYDIDPAERFLNLHEYAAAVLI